jgi:predicted RNA-binding Zn-ribbon protein involved in translation (DUF1610 family)
VDQQVQLIPLVCTICQTHVPAQPDEVAWVCGQCGQGLLLDVSKGLVPLEVKYAQGIGSNSPGKPFWVTEGRVAFTNRQTYSGNEDREAHNFWAQPRQFFVPAFNSPLEALLELGSKFLQQPPSLQPGPAARFEPVTLALEDVKPLAEFIVMALEAGRKDKLKEIQFSVELSSPVLWILP